MSAITIRGFEELTALLGTNLNEHLQAAAIATAHEVEDRMVAYPDVTDANNSSNRRWYQRGVGAFYRRRDGTVRSYGGSETMNRRWTVSPHGATGAKAVNTASYVQYVQDAKSQAGAMKRIGWQTDEDVLKRVVDDGTAEHIFTDALNHALNLKP